ncbi:hypothetical protein HPB50_023340 [Hyalomma asiaticum]|uniref:Uncharacterized protein n=1 Tax=Hyalomma asiaticum TaxID=266040 RepID=A0ACB7TM96_HYAAI|nr:hypothetical protein HPB50_023340 [Hyalomma asiaticum]
MVAQGSRLESVKANLPSGGRHAFRAGAARGAFRVGRSEQTCASRCAPRGGAGQLPKQHGEPPPAVPPSKGFICGPAEQHVSCPRDPGEPEAHFRRSPDCARRRHALHEGAVAGRPAFFGRVGPKPLSTPKVTRV